MKLTAFLLTVCFFILPESKAQDVCPPNIDFEQGDFTNWQCDTGSTYASGISNFITLTPSGPMANRHEIISAANGIQLDPYGNFPMVCPAGGNYSVKLGNNSSGKQAESISYTFQVPPGQDTFSITYYYAVVFQNPGHSDFEQPRFEVKAIDVLTGLPVNCASYQFVAGSVPGFDTSQLDQTVQYKKWSPVSLSLSGLAGRMVRLRFTTADCTRGIHFGYAYIDVQSGCSQIIANAAHCIGTNTAVFNAPYGYKTYTWYNSNYSQVVGTGQSVSLTPAPLLGTLFHVDMEPYPGYGCRDTADAVITELPIPDTPAAQSYYLYCKNEPVAPLSATASNGSNILYWYTSSFGGIPSLIAPTPSTSAAGTYHYYVSQKEPFGCESYRKEITVEVKPTPVASFSVNQVSQCLEGNSYSFINTSQLLDPASSYEWSFGDGTTSTLSSPTHVYTLGGYFDVMLKVTNPPHCVTQKNIQVRVVPKPVASFSYPDKICDNQTQVILADNSSLPVTGISFINSWFWNIGGVSSNLQNPASFYYPAGNLLIKQAVSTVEGCKSDTNTVILPVHYLPTAKFSYSRPLCENENIRFFDQSFLPAAAPAQEQVSKWTWTASNGSSSSVQNPSFHFSTGLFDTKLVAETNFGCTSLVADSFFLIHEKPSVQVTMSDSCINRTISIQAKDQLGNVSEWWWNFGPGLYQSQQTMTRSFPSPGQHSFTLIGKTVYGCKDTLVHPFKIYKLNIFAGNDTVTAMNEPVQLHSIASDVVAQYVWTPPTGLNDPTKADPVAILDRDQQYFLSAISDKGCEAYSKVLVRRYKGPALYIPTGFTPNGDGLNDVLKVFPVGIRSFINFSVYNRGGELIFTTDDYSRGWDGTYKGAASALGNYVVTAKAIDYKGNVMQVKQNVILIR